MRVEGSEVVRVAALRLFHCFTCCGGGGRRVLFTCSKGFFPDL